MIAYYNEIDPYAADWLESLIAENLIAPGIVDRRSIADVQPTDLAGFTQCHFFAGIGGWSLALRLAGWPDDRPVWTGSCPCQPFSAAGRRKGTSDERHLWPHMYRLIREHRPAILFGEQVASKDALAWWDGVSTDLEAEDYACAAADMCAAGIGAPLIRQRLYWMGITNNKRFDRKHPLLWSNKKRGKEDLPEASRTGPWSDYELLPYRDGKGGIVTRRSQPRSFPLAHRLPRSVGPGSTREQRLGLMAAKANRGGRLKGYGNAIVPQLAADFIQASMEATITQGPTP